jgi:hypothetical protein
MRSIFWYPILALLVLSFLVNSPSFVHAQEQNETSLEVVSITTTPHWMINYEWKLDHWAEPHSWEMWKGDRGRSLFTIAATRSDGNTSAWIQGEVCIHNNGLETIQDPVVLVELHAAGAAIAAAQVINDRTTVLVPSQAACLRYRLEIPATYILAGGNYSVRAAANMHGATREGSSTEVWASVELPDRVQAYNEQVQVTVPGVRSWVLTGSEQIQYEQTFTCDAAQGVQARMATIFETGQSARAEVSVACYGLEIWPTIRTYHNRIHYWAIDLHSDAADITLLPDETAQMAYLVDLTHAGYTDLYYRASGSIFVRNRAPFEAVLTGLEAALSKGNRLTLNCKGIEFPYTLESGGLMSCQYSAYAEQGEIITATAMVLNKNLHYVEQASNSGVTPFNSIPRTISYDTIDTVYESSECVNVSADSYGRLGRVCREEPGKTTSFTYTGEVGPYERCGSDLHEERASFTPNGMSSARYSVIRLKINIPCSAGCTRTPGYWLTNSGYRPNQYDPTWNAFKELYFFKSSRTWEGMIHTNTTTNPYYPLARQFIAARLNIAKGAHTTQEIRQLLQETENVLNTYAPHEISRAKVSLQREIQNLAVDLDHFNRGLTGPGACSRQPMPPPRR